MADKRMFSKTIIESDLFLNMTPKTQMLYIHLSMHADDDGFVGNPQSVLRMIGASKSDLKILEKLNFVITFSSGVLVVTHWKQNNTIRSDRYQETKYLEEKSKIRENPSKEYILMDTNGCQLVSHTVPKPDTQYRLDKNSIGYTPLTPQGEAEQSESLKVEKAKGTAKAVNHSKTSVQIRFQSFWEAYPKKKAKGDALKAFNKLNPDDSLMEKMLSALEWQKKSFDWTKDGGQYIPLPASWIRGMRWEDEPEAAVKKEGRKWKILD